MLININATVQNMNINIFLLLLLYYFICRKENIIVKGPNYAQFRRIAYKLPIRQVRRNKIPQILVDTAAVGNIRIRNRRDMLLKILIYYQNVISYIICTLPCLGFLQRHADKDTDVRDKTAIGMHNSYGTRLTLFYPKENLNIIVMYM